MMWIQLQLTGTLDISARTITFTGYTIDSPLRIELIWDVTTAKTLYQWNKTAFIGSWNATYTVLTLNAGVDLTWCANIDLLQIAVADMIWQDVWLNTNITSETNPVRTRRTDWEAIIPSAQTLTTSFADLWPEFDCKGFNTITIWLKCTVNASTGIQLRALWKHTYAGTEEMALPIESVTTAVINVTPEIVQFPDWINFLYAITAKVNNSIPYIQRQVKMSVDGGTDWTIDTANITKGY
jgi:hypothetical protein